MFTKLRYFVFLALFFTFGLTWFQSISEPNFTIRDPASIRGKIYHISSLSSEEIKYRLQNKIKVHPTKNGKKEISFSGFSAALCKTYPLIEVEFAAEGIAVAGEAPTMNITTPCETSINSDEMAPIYLPIAQILNEKPRNADFSYQGYSATISFHHAADEWPKQWILKRVEFKNREVSKNKTASFDRSPASVDERPIVLEF